MKIKDLPGYTHEEYFEINDELSYDRTIEVIEELKELKESASQVESLQDDVDCLELRNKELKEKLDEVGELIDELKDVFKQIEETLN
jgi:peptidoglycan hydrolase CwlO-like protein